MNVDKIRADFPILHHKIGNYPLAYLDNAATTQKPIQVLQAMQNFYEQSYANVHRGVHELTTAATQSFEQARKKAQAFIGAKHDHECIFVHGATEGINIVVNGFGRTILKPKDEIIISVLEHHSNIVPWQLVCEYTGAKLRVIPCNEQGELELAAYKELLNEKTKIVAITHISNAFGTINPIKEMIQLAHENDTPILIDGAQVPPHLAIDVQKLDCDFYTFSGHKMYGPTGIGILYGKTHWLDRLPPFQGGGEMIKSVSFEKTTYQDLPFKFEAGTPAITQAVGLGCAFDYLQNIGLTAILAHENNLLHYATELLNAIPTLRIIGTAANKIGIISFILEDMTPHDIGTFLNEKGIAVRTGLHCAEPAIKRFGIKGTVRVSFGLYNTREEVERLAVALREIKTPPSRAGR